jgi:hypothetical protein
MTSCKQKINIYDYMNYYTIKALSYINSNNIKVCDYLNYFGSNACNSIILCYITDVGDVLTLNYEYFGKNKGNLTVQHDIMNNLLNKSILPNYRKLLINKNTSSDIALPAISFTNCLENNNSGTTNLKRLKESIIPASKYAKKYELEHKSHHNTIYNLNHETKHKLHHETKNNSQYESDFNKLAPAIWQFNFIPNNNFNLLYNVNNINTQNSCPIKLSTSQNYNTPVKYAEFYDNGKTGLTLHNGGINQQLFLENVNILSKSHQGSFNDIHIAMTANIRLNNRLYLIPNKSNNGFSNKSVNVELQDEPEENGKWLILGFTLNTLPDLKNILLNIQNYFP